MDVQYPQVTLFDCVYVCVEGVLSKCKDVSGTNRSCLAGTQATNRKGIGWGVGGGGGNIAVFMNCLFSFAEPCLQ